MVFQAITFFDTYLNVVVFIQLLLGYLSSNIYIVKAMIIWLCVYNRLALLLLSLTKWQIVSDAAGFSC